MIHAIMATWAFDEAKKREALSRRCPKCRREQIASEEKINEPIPCEKCAAEVPPKAFAALEAKETGEQANDRRSGRKGGGLW